MADGIKPLHQFNHTWQSRYIRQGDIVLNEFSNSAITES